MRKDDTKLCKAVYLCSVINQNPGRIKTRKIFFFPEDFCQIYFEEKEEKDVIKITKL
jgi:hypothetical protein